MRARRRMVALLVLVVLVAAGLGLAAMPGRSHCGVLPPLTSEQRELADELRRDVEHLAGLIGERHALRPAGLQAAREHVGEALRATGLEPREHEFEAAGRTFANVWAEIAGRERSAREAAAGPFSTGC